MKKSLILHIVVVLVLCAITTVIMAVTQAPYWVNGLVGFIIGMCTARHYLNRNW